MNVKPINYFIVNYKQSLNAVHRPQWTNNKHATRKRKKIG